MKTVHIARPQYPSYRVSRLTAKYPVAELVVGAVLCALILAAGLAVIA